MYFFTFIRLFRLQIDLRPSTYIINPQEFSVQRKWSRMIRTFRHFVNFRLFRMLLIVIRTFVYVNQFIVHDMPLQRFRFTFCSLKPICELCIKTNNVGMKLFPLQLGFNNFLYIFILIRLGFDRFKARNRCVGMPSTVLDNLFCRPFW